MRGAAAALLALASLPGTALGQAPAVEVIGEACGLATSLPRALARRGVLGGELTVRVVIDDARIHIAIADHAGVALERSVPRSPSCAADLDLVALIVERQQRDLGLDADDGALPPPPSPLDVTVEVGARAGPEVATRVRADITLVGRVELGRFVELTAAARLVPPSEVAVSAPAGEAALGGWALGADAGAGIGLDTGSTRLFLDVTAGVERFEATASGALFQRLDAASWTAVLAVGGRYDRAVWEDLVWLSFGLVGRFRTTAPTFTVEGASARYEVPAATLVGQLGLWVRLF